MNFCLKDLKNKINKNTKAIIAVHLYGNPCEISEIRSICKKKGIYLIEDCAQAFGAEIRKKKIGNFGDFGSFNFFPNKKL